MSIVSTALLDIPVPRNDGQTTSLAEFRGKVLLVVNVASKCGLTSQYKGLEAIYRRFHPNGFEVLAFPANDFAGQEPGSNDEIRSFCTTNFDVTFPLFGKLAVTGPDAHPLFQALVTLKPDPVVADPGFRAGLENFLSSTGTGAHTNPSPGILWNFEKFLIDRNGNVVARFAPDMLPEDPRILSAIEAAL